MLVSKYILSYWKSNLIQNKPFTEYFLSQIRQFSFPTQRQNQITKYNNP